MGEFMAQSACKMYVVYMSHSFDSVFELTIIVDHGICLANCSSVNIILISIQVELYFSKLHQI